MDHYFGSILWPHRLEVCEGYLNRTVQSALYFIIWLNVFEVLLKTAFSIQIALPLARPSKVNCSQRNYLDT